MLEYLAWVLMPAAVVVGVVWGKWQRKHRHTWTPWTRIWDEDEQVLSKDQERFCRGCNLREESVYASGECPPHRWGRWEDWPILYNKKPERGQRRVCETCGGSTLRRVDSQEPK